MLPLTNRKTTSSKWLLSEKRLQWTLALRLSNEVASKTSTTSTITERPHWWKRETKGYDKQVTDTVLRKDRSNQMQSKATLSPWSCHTKIRPNIGQKISIALTANATTPIFTRVIQRYRRFRSRNYNRLSDSRQSMSLGIIRWADKFLTLTWIHLIPLITWLLSKIEFDSIIMLLLPILRSTAPSIEGK